MSRLMIPRRPLEGPKKKRSQCNRTRGKGWKRLQGEKIEVETKARSETFIPGGIDLIKKLLAKK